MHQKFTIEDLDIVVVHYRWARPTVAMINALFTTYAEATITLVDNSGGECSVSECIIPHIADYSSRIRILDNSAKGHGRLSDLSHGAGLDLAIKNSKKPYLLSLETDTFLLERGPIEYVLSLIEQGYDWAGFGQKPVDGYFGSFSPSFAFFKVALIKEQDLSFRVRAINHGEIDQDHPLLRHHRQTAQRVKRGLPLLFPQEKPPDTYSRSKNEIEKTELGHLNYFDTGEWVHYELKRNGFKGYLFLPPKGVCHTWGSRNEVLFLQNIRKNLPDLDINTLLPKKLRINNPVESEQNSDLSFLDGSREGLSSNWKFSSGSEFVSFRVSNELLHIEAGMTATQKAYLSLGAGSFDSPPQKLNTQLTASAPYELKCEVGALRGVVVQLWLIEYGERNRITHHNCKLKEGETILSFLSSPKSDKFRILFRITGAGKVCLKKLELNPIRLRPERQLPNRIHNKRKPLKSCCIVISADALRADYWKLAGQFGALNSIPALREFKADSVTPVRAYSAATWTLPSHMSMFTGLHPHQHGYGLNFEVGKNYPVPTHVAFLPMYLRSKGIETFGFHNGGVLDPQRGMGVGWTEYNGSHPGDVDDPIHAFIRKLPDLGEEFFAFIHTYAVHNYYGECATPLVEELISPLQRRYVDSLFEKFGNLRWLMAENMQQNDIADDRTIDAVQRLYTGAVIRFDNLLRQITDALKTSGNYDNATIILLSDHGEALGEVHSGIQHWSHMTINVHEETVRVPFMLKPSKHTEISLPKILSLVDLPNIVTQCFGLPLAFPERNEFSVFATGATNQFGAEWGRTITPERRIYHSMYMEDNWKYHLLGDDFTMSKKCDITSDGIEYEMNDSDMEQFDIAMRIRPFIERIPFEGNSTKVVDDDILEQMRGLGYLD